MDEVNEKSTAYLTVNFFDEADLPATPSAVNYRIDCLSTGAQVRGVTSIGAASNVKIPLLAVDNVIQNQQSVIETRRVTIEATYGPGDAIHDQFDYYVRNLLYVN